MIPSTNSLISVVDDDQSISRMLRRALTSAGFDVVSFSSAEEFLESEPAMASECLILDMNLPGMSGIELQKQLIQRRVDIPVIFMSANANRIVQQRVLEAGAVGFLSKPFSIEVLLAKVRGA